MYVKYSTGRVTATCYLWFSQQAKPLQPMIKTMEKQAVRRELRRKEKTEIDQMLTDIGKKGKQICFNCITAGLLGDSHNFGTLA